MFRNTQTVASRLLFVLTLCVVTRGSPATPQKLLVILLDGCRWDYAGFAQLSNFHRVRMNGAHAAYLINAFPTLSYPNYYTLMTGLHPESHGVTGDFGFDLNFVQWATPEQINSVLLEGSEPVWITAVKQNKRSFLYYWPECDVTIRGLNATFCIPYEERILLDEFSSSLQTALDKLESDEADLALVYYDDLDTLGHMFGPGTTPVIENLKDIDIELGKLLDRLDRLPENNKVNLLVMSDHGITCVDPNRTINLTSVLLNNSALVDRIAGEGPIVSIYTADQEKTDQLYDVLKTVSTNMNVYKKDQIPDRYHYKNGRFVGNITCVADMGWFIVHPGFPRYPVFEGKVARGYHGYDNNEEDMRGIFHAYGPYFKKGATVRSVNAVDSYNIMCDILNLTPEPNNGSETGLMRLLANSAEGR